MSLAKNRLMDITQLALTWLGGQTVKNLRRIACKFDLDQRERKSSQVNASTRKAWLNGVASGPSFQLASTCDFVWPGLNNGHIIHPCNKHCVQISQK